MRGKLVVEFLDNLYFPYNETCVNYIVNHWEHDHKEQLQEIDGFEIDEDDVRIYWFDYVENLFKEATK